MRQMQATALLLSLMATSCALSERPTLTENTPLDHPFRVSLSVSPFTNAMIASGATFSDGKHHARTDEELQRLFVAHGASEIYPTGGGPLQKPITPNPNALKTKMLKFEKMKLSDDMFEAASVFDVNKDGHLDIVCGSFWYAGPGFGTSHKICDISTQREGAEKLEGFPYDMETITGYDDFANIPLDVNGDGYMDIVTGGWFGRTLQWRENPKGKPEEWEVHDIEEIGEIETIRIWDVDGDGDPEILPNTPLGPQRIFKLVRDDAGKGTGKFRKLTISDQPSGHGLGFGDINMDGRSDIVRQSGWLEAPENPLEEEWKRHSEFNLVGLISVPILVLDINGDGLNDLIVGQAHNYGIAWHEQKRKADGTREWTKHDIDTTRSQYHDMALVDIDNDGEQELITGKRCLSHWGNDPGAYDPAGLYYFKIKGGDFQLHIIDEGPMEVASGTGIYLWVADIDGNGWKDIVAPGKEGLYLFKNMGPA